MTRRQDDQPVSPDPASATAAPMRCLTWRSVLIGSIGIVLTNALMPYNDEVVINTRLAGSYLPVILIGYLFVLIVLINAPLRWLSARHALSAGELAVIVAMVLVGCSIPQLMRTFFSAPITGFYYGSLDEAVWKAFVGLDLPGWLFPVSSMEEGRLDPVVLDFIGRVPPGTPIPYGAWIVPMLGWGIFLGAFLAVLLASAVLLRPQWAYNERLPFPLAQLELALIQQPRRGRVLNDLFRSRVFWLTVVAIFIIHTFNAFALYFPKVVPRIPLRYDLSGVMSNEPLVYVSWHVRSNAIYFSLVGVCYFLQSRTSFSLWAIYLIVQLVSVSFRSFQQEIPGGAWFDQHLGACVAFAGGVLWIGRHHWKTVLLQAIRGRSSNGQDSAPDLSYRTAMLILIGGLTVMLAWLVLLGVSAWVAVLTVAFMMLAHLVASRVVAETGIPMVRPWISLNQVVTNMSPSLFSGRDIFFSGAGMLNGVSSSAASVMGFGMHGLQVAEGAGVPPRARRGLLTLLGWSLALACFVGAWAWLYCEYSHAGPVNAPGGNIINWWGMQFRPSAEIIDPLRAHARGQFAAKSHNPWQHMGIGLVITAVLQLLSLLWANWPFMPVGYLVACTWQAEVAWFSLFVGWLVKVLVVKYGGARMYQSSRPFFVGLIFGETLAAAIWGAITLVLAWAGYDYRVFDLLPH